MGRRCCINGCNSNSRLPEHCGVTFHSFPLDAAIRALWIRNTRLSGDRQITKSVLVCSRHFRRVDFQTQRTGKFLLKQRVFPTVFPWGKIDTAQIDSDLMTLKAVGDVSSPQASSSVSAATSTEDATVQATVAQIMAETAELNAAAAAAGKSPAAAATATSNKNADTVFVAAVVGAAIGTRGAGPSPLTTIPRGGINFGPATTFNMGSRLEAQDFDGKWHLARVIEVDNDDREVLIKFEHRRIGKNKSNVDGPEEWIPMNSTRLRQKMAKKPPVFQVDEKCMARWSGPRKFPGTVKKSHGNATYEVLFDDGYVKDVRAVHMQKIPSLDSETASHSSASADVSPERANSMPETSNSVAVSLKSSKNASSSAIGSSNSKKRSAPGPRKDWPLLDMSKLDLRSLNLPEIPHDGEWTCHWVNDQPIGCEGFLIVGEHRKPTVIVEDWRLPPGWVKHMYQRSNVLGKWDVILVTPSNKRFRSKADLKVFLEDQGIVYNPDIYDFSIHRRRAKDIKAYVYTADYSPQQTPKPRSLATSLDLLSTPTSKNAGVTPLAVGASQFIDTPEASAELPMELMTTTSLSKSTGAAQTSAALSFPPDRAGVACPPVDNNFAFIGGLKVEIVDNLFRCPQEGCSKNFRKENHLQIHVKHYHHNLVKLLGECPKMLELAEKRTHPERGDSAEPVPKNQIPNQQFFAKLHQQDLEHARTHRRSGRGSTTPEIDAKETAKRAHSSTPTDRIFSLNDSTAGGSSMLELAVTSSAANDSLLSAAESTPASLVKRARFMPSKRAFGSRKSSRQRTTRRYLTAAQATAGVPLRRMITADSSFGASEFEETRHSFNATPDAKSVEPRRRKPMAAPSTPLSSSESPMTADSGSSSFQPLHAPPAGNEAEGAVGGSSSGGVMQKQTHYVKENGDIVKIVSMRQEEIINCLCSYGEEDGLMIQCELCLCWQHGACNGIEKEEEVPEKYVCFICRHPQRQRESLRFKHDQEWLYEGKLPVANYHSVNPNLPKRFEFLKNSHTLTGNLIELKQFVESLRVKVNIANNRSHPKLYLWAKKWEEEAAKTTQPGKDDCETDLDVKLGLDGEVLPNETSPSKRDRSDVEPETPAPSVPHVPQPEAPIDPVECQQRLLEHINVQQELVNDRLGKIEKEIEELEKGNDIANMRDIDMNIMKEVIALFMRDLEALQKVAKLNAAENVKLEQQSNNSSN